MTLIKKTQDSLVKMAFTTNIRLGLFEKLHGFISSGIPILDILNILHEEYSKSDSVTDPRAYVLKQWYYNINNNGMKLSEAMRGWVPPSEIVLISSGEKSGNIAEALKNAIDATTATKAMVGTIIGKLVYPVILVTLLILSIYGFAIYIIPILVKTSAPENWPAASQNLYHISNFVTENGSTVLLLFVAFGFLVAKSLPRLTGPLRHYLDKVPPYSMYRSLQSSITLVAIASLLRSNTPINDALDLTYKESTGYVKSHLRKIMNNLEIKGGSIGQAFDIDFFDYETKVDIAVYSRIGDIGSHMLKIGLSAIKNGIAKVSIIANMVNLLAVASIAIYICWSYYSFFMVMQSIGGGR